jgi:hypothetical protein
MKKGLFLLVGECFREGSPLSRIIDTEYGINTQHIASKSHMKLAKSIANYTIDIAISSRRTNNMSLLLNYYENIVYTLFTDNRPFTFFNQVVHSAIDEMTRVFDISPYDFIFVCRIDLLLKETMIQEFNPSWQQITYPNVMSINTGGLCLSDGVCISDVFVFIPRKYYTPLSCLTSISPYLLDHSAVEDLVHKRLLILEDIGFATDFTYISNTEKFSNPYYAIICRPEGPSYLEGWSNKKYDRITHRIIDA